jgi:2TM domain
MGSLQMTSDLQRVEMPRDQEQLSRDVLSEGMHVVKTSDVPTTYLQAATQIQRWRDFGSHAAAYVVMNVIFVVIWALTGEGFFWPIFPLIGWGIGLSAQHFNVVLRGQITDEDVRRALR